MAVGSNRTKTGISAWLITWENLGEHAQPQEKVAAILSARFSGEKVRELVEVLYANSKYTPSERIDVVRNRRNNPYPPRLNQIETGKDCCVGCSRHKYTHSVCIWTSLRGRLPIRAPSRERTAQ